MLFTMTKRKSEPTQKSLLKLQFSTITLVIHSFIRMQVQGSEFSEYSLVALLGTFALPIVPVLLLLGGFAVVNLFKENHPLLRRDPSQNLKGLNTEQEADFLKQNEAIASEPLRYAEKLDRWPYLISKL